MPGFDFGYPNLWNSTNELHVAESFLRFRYSVNSTRNSQPFVEPEVSTCTHNIPSLDLILSHFNPIHTLTSYFLKVYLKIVPKWISQVISFLQVYLPKCYMNFPFVPCVPHALTILPTWFVNEVNVEYKLWSSSIMQFCSSSYYYLSLISTYSSRTFFSRQGAKFHTHREQVG
jgi:hypothetical protein